MSNSRQKTSSASAHLAGMLQPSSGAAQAAGSSHFSLMFLTELPAGAPSKYVGLWETVLRLQNLFHIEENVGDIFFSSINKLLFINYFFWLFCFIACFLF